MPKSKLKKAMKRRYLMVADSLALVVMINGIMMLIPLLLILFYKDEIDHFWGMFLPGMLCVIFGIIIRKMVISRDDITLDFTEGGVVVVLAWFISIALSLIPFLLVERLPLTHAAFEAVSGLTTTGLSMIDVESASRMILLYRSILQLVGGAGIAIIMISAIIGPQGMGLYSAEGRADNLIPNIIRSTKLILKIYLSYAVIGVFLFYIAGMSWFDAINHSFSAVSTGGFSTRTNSIGSYNSLNIELVAMILMILGSINFGAQYLLLTGNWKEFLKIDEIQMKGWIFILMLPLLIYLGTISVYRSLNESLQVGLFELVSSMTTTGFTSTTYMGWHELALFILVLVMILGGGYGSTSGGIKIFRGSVLLKSLYWQFQRYFLPKNVVKEHYIHRSDGKYFINKTRQIEIGNFVILYLLFFILMNFIYLLFGFTLIESMFESATVLSGVGLSIGITTVTTHPIILWTQIIGMILGRLEFIIVFVGLSQLFRDLRSYRSD